MPLRSQTFESSGPDGKIRGTAQRVFDRYLALARDAYSSRRSDHREKATTSTRNTIIDC